MQDELTAAQELLCIIIVAELIPDASIHPSSAFIRIAGPQEGDAASSGLLCNGRGAGVGRLTRGALARGGLTGRALACRGLTSATGARRGGQASRGLAR